MSTLDSPLDTHPDPSNVSPRPIGIRYGLIAALVSIVAGLGFHLAGMVDYAKNSFLSLPNIVNYIIIIGFLYVAIQKHRDEELGGYISFGRSVGVGFWMGLAMGVVSGIWAIIFFNLIEPELLSTIMVQVEENMLDEGMAEEQVEMAMSYTKMFMSPVAMGIFAILGSIISTVIFSLVLGAFMKNEAPEHA